MSLVSLVSRHWLMIMLIIGCVSLVSVLIMGCMSVASRHWLMRVLIVGVMILTVIGLRRFMMPV